MALAFERQRLILLMTQTVASQAAHGNWHYLAIRPQSVRYTSADLAGKVFADCSDGCRILAYAAGIKDDPAGNTYAPYGNSSSIWAHSHHITFAEVQPGDMFTFGYSTGEHHVCMAWAPAGDLDWWVWNHGAPGQPHKTLLSKERNAHSGMTVTACRLNVPDPPPTPEDLLRAKTGFYAWVAWRLAEGPWKGYPKADPSVRPNVPRLISPLWWKNYLAFLAARKKANP